MSPRRRAGFTLIEIVVVIAVLAILITMAAAITRGVAAAQKRSLTTTRLATVDAALVQFVMQQKRLPCPADGTRPSTDTTAGTETARTDAAGCTTDQHGGVVPWRALGLAETDATDGWDRRFTYRIDPALAKLDGMNMSWCDPAGSGPLVGGVCRNDGTCTSTSLGSCTPPSLYLANKGLQVRKADGTTTLMDPAATPPTGAAYVVVSTGESGGGAYLGSGVLGQSAVGDGTMETTHNYASLPFASVAVTYYVDDDLADTGGAGHFDDILSRPTVLAVITKAGLGPRAH